MKPKRFYIFYNSLNQAVSANHNALKKIKPLLDANQQLMTDYDAEANAFGKALARAGGQAAMDEHLQQQNRDLAARRLELMPQIRTISLCLEKQASLLQTNASLLRQLMEHKGDGNQYRHKGSTGPNTNNNAHKHHHQRA